MTELYKDAIIEAKKLREVAIDEAKNKIIEAIAPYLQTVIMQESQTAGSSIFEEDDLTSDSLEDAMANDAAVMPNVPVAMPMDAPVAPVDPGLVSMPLPDEDGKIVLDFDALFTGGPQGDTVEPADLSAVAPGEQMPTEPSEPAPIASASPTAAPEGAASPEAMPPEGDTGEELGEPAPLTENYNDFVKSLGDLNFKIDYALHRGNRINDIMQESMKNKLFSLLESLDKMHESGKVSSKMVKINEKRLEFLFLKLKEANLHNSYTQAKVKENAMSKSLKEFAASLFESEDQESLAHDSASTGKTGVAVDKEMTDHAMKQSGVSPEVDDLFAEALEAAETTSTAGAGKAGSVDADELLGLDLEEMPHEEGEPLAEELEALGHAGFGDADEDPVASPEMFFEVDEEELKEAVRAIRKENFVKKARALREAKLKKEMKEKGWEEGKASKDDPAKKVLKKEEKKKKMHEMVEEDIEMMLSLDLPDEVEDLLDPEDLEVDVEVRGADEMGDEEELDLDMGGEEEEEEEDEDAELEMGDEDALLLVDDEKEEEEEEKSMEAAALMESRRVRTVVKQARVLKEAAVRARRDASAYKRLAESRKNNLIGLKRELNETNLFLSKLLYLNKFLQLEGLTKKQKQHIVEHLDKAKTIAEAKMIYGKIKNKLNEGASTGKPTGSSSKVVGTGSARLNESVNGTNGSGVDPVVGTFDRWQTLAQIKKDSK